MKTATYSLCTMLLMSVACGGPLQDDGMPQDDGLPAALQAAMAPSNAKKYAKLVLGSFRVARLMRPATATQQKRWDFFFTVEKVCNLGDGTSGWSTLFVWPEAKEAGGKFGFGFRDDAFFSALFEKIGFFKRCRVCGAGCLDKDIKNLPAS